MTRKQRADILAAIARQTAEHTALPEKARSFLLSTGIYTADGELAPEYGGPPYSENHVERA